MFTLVRSSRGPRASNERFPALVTIVVVPTVTTKYKNQEVSILNCMK